MALSEYASSTTPGTLEMGDQPESLPLDSLDHDLIALLQNDGRASSASLARTLKIDQRTARKRIDRLIGSRVIRIAAVTDPTLLGYRSKAMVCISMNASSVGDSSRLLREICQFPEVDYVTVTTGRFTMQAEVLCANDAQLQQVLLGKFQKYPEIASMEVLYYLRLHFQRAWFTGGGWSIAAPGVRPADLDRVDRQLVSRLAENGRLTFEALAAELEISETMVRKRYAALSDSGAMRVVAIANPLHLGYAASCWVAITCTPEGRAHDIAEALTRIEDASYVMITAGSIDLMVELVCRSHEHLISLIDSRVRPIRGVERAEAWMYLDLVYKPILPI